MRIITVAILLVIFISLCSCKKDGPNEKAIISGNGTIKDMRKLDGCDFQIQSNNISYSPINLTNDYKANGKAIYFKAIKRTDMVDSCMAGEIVEIIYIEGLNQIN